MVVKKLISVAIFTICLIKFHFENALRSQSTNYCSSLKTGKYFPFSRDTWTIQVQYKTTICFVFRLGLVTIQLNMRIET